MSALDHLWAGWRSEYLTTATADAGSTSPTGGDAAETGAAKGAERCVFCRILASGRPDEETNVVWRHDSGDVVALLNAYPYATGHVLIMPVRHVGELDALTADEAAALWGGVTATVAALKHAYDPDGTNVGINLGRAAGAGIPGHLHVHVLPRWVGDSNFMTSIAETRVLPEALSVTAAKLRAAWARS